MHHHSQAYFFSLKQNTVLFVFKFTKTIDNDLLLINIHEIGLDTGDEIHTAHIKRKQASLPCECELAHSLNTIVIEDNKLYSV